MNARAVRVEFEDDVFAAEYEEVRVFGDDAGYDTTALEECELGIGFVRCNDVLDSFGSQSLWAK